MCISSYSYSVINKGRNMSNECELCFDSIARIYCESDEARLCWKCDEKVHCANFLVSRHIRNLLCHVCHSKTPWEASGSKLINGRPSVFVCENCAGKRKRIKGDGDDYNDVFGDGNVDQGEMVVPKSSSSTSFPRPPSVVISSSDESVEDVADIDSHDQDDYLCCSFSETNYLGTASLATGWKSVSFNHDNATSLGPFDHSKKRKKDQTMTSATQTKSRKTLKLMGTLIELQQDMKTKKKKKKKKHCSDEH